jgi:hypothetical protein
MLRDKILTEDALTETAGTTSVKSLAPVDCQRATDPPLNSISYAKLYQVPAVHWTLQCVEELTSHLRRESDVPASPEIQPDFSSVK